MFKRPVPCPTCSYDLRAHAGPDGAQCPECGLRFNRSELIISFKSPNLKWLRPCFIAAMILPALAILLMYFIDARSIGNDLMFNLSFYFILLILPFALAFAFVYGVEKHMVNPARIQFGYGVAYLILVPISNGLIVFLTITFFSS